MPRRSNAGQGTARTASGKSGSRTPINLEVKIVLQAKEEFWDIWVREVFPALLKQQKWFKYKRDVKVGDIVLRKDETAAGQTYKYARVAKVHVGTNGKVRAADEEYKVPGETRFPCDHETHTQTGADQPRGGAGD
jgi:hypothetical protein